jgi:hypothetical protein
MTIQIPRSRRRRLLGLGSLGVFAAIAVTGVIAATSGAATNTVAPALSGTAQQGQTLTSTTGTWTLNGTPTYTFRWQRCNPDASGCADISGATGSSYLLRSADVTNAVRSVVTADDADPGTQEQASAVTEPVSPAAGLVPANTAVPTISGTPRTGETLTAAEGQWSGVAPISYTYEWQLCDPTGNACAALAGATARILVLPAGAVGKTVRVKVTGANATGSASAISSATPPVIDVVKLTDGSLSVAAADVKLPERLIVDRFSVQQSQPLRTRAPFLVTFRVVDTRGYVVKGALVSLTGLPYNRILGADERSTGPDGTVTFTLTPTKLQPLKVGARLVIFARARVAGDQLLAGVSTRRLVEVVFGAAS